jgi:hypothetical protein
MRDSCLAAAHAQGALAYTVVGVLCAHVQDAKAEKFKEISKLVQEPRMDTLGVPTTSAL